MLQGINLKLKGKMREQTPETEIVEEAMTTIIESEIRAE